MPKLKYLQFHVKRQEGKRSCVSFAQGDWGELRQAVRSDAMRVAAALWVRL